MKRVAITGATGFVGRALVPALESRGWSVRPGVRRSVGTGQVAYGDLSESVDWAPLVDGIDVVVHLAGVAHTDGVPEDLYDQINHRQTAALAEAACRANVKRLVFVSSVRAQSGPTSSHMLDEQEVAAPSDAYGRSKLAAERAVAASGVAYAILRPVLIYGPGVKGNLAALERLAKLPVPLPFGAMRNRRSLCSLDGLIEAIELVAVEDRARNRTFLAADREPIELRALIAALRRGLGRRPALVPVPPAVIRLALRAVRRSGIWERLGGELAVSSARLAALGWRARDTGDELARVRLS